MEFERAPRQPWASYESALNESNAPAPTSPSITRLFREPCPKRSVKSKNDLNGPSLRDSIIELTIDWPSPLIAASPYLMAPLVGVNPEKLSFTSGGSSL